MTVVARTGVEDISRGRLAGGYTRTRPLPDWNVDLDGGTNVGRNDLSFVVGGEGSIGQEGTSQGDGQEGEECCD